MSKSKNLIKKLLMELRIDQKCLEVMASGYSPNVSGTIDFVGKEWKNYRFPFPIVQLSQNTAQNILDLGLNLDAD
jgi:hypothetical protein